MRASKCRTSRDQGDRGIPAVLHGLSTQIAPVQEAWRETMTRRPTTPIPYRGLEALPEAASSAIGNARAPHLPEAWTLFTQIAASSDSKFEIRISVGHGAAGKVFRRYLPVIGNFPTAASAAAFLMRWIEEYHELNPDAGPKQP
jgi:hypothetical protein